MADFDDIKEQLKDISNYIGILAEEASNKLGASLEQGITKTGDIAEYFKQILKTSSDLPKSIKTVADLEKRILSDTKFYNKIKSEILKSQKIEIKEYWQKAEKHIESQVLNIDDIYEKTAKRLELQKKFRDVEKESVGRLNKQLNDMKPKSALEKIMAGIALKLQKGLVNTVDKLKKLPTEMAAAFSDVLLSAKDVPTSIDRISKPIDDLLDSIPYVGGLFKFAFQTIRSSFFATWEYIEQRVLPTNKKLIEQFGMLDSGVQKIKSQAIGTGNLFVKMGLGFEAGRDAIVNFAAALKTTDFSILNTGFESIKRGFKETMQLGLRLTKVVGLSAEQAGNLSIAFDRSGTSLTELNQTMSQAAVVAKEYGVIPNQLRKDIGENIGVLQRFGIANRMEFTKASALARAYGTSIKEINGAFGQQLDTFEGSAKAAAKLNTIFGTQINSFELMMETDPTKRMVMLGKEMEKQGKSWEKLNVVEKNVIKSTLQINDEMGGLVFSQKNVGKGVDALSAKIKKQEREKAKMLKADKDWKKSISSLRITLINLEEEIKDITRAVADSIAKFLGFNGALSATEDMGKYLRDFFSNISGMIEKWNKGGGPQKFRDDLSKLVDTVTKAARPFILAGEAIDTFGKITDGVFGGIGASAAGLFDKSGDVENIAKGLPPDMIRKILKSGKFEGEDLSAGDAAALIALIGKKESVQDALITKTGKIVEFSPQDNILATKMPIDNMVAGASTADNAVSAPVQDQIIQVNLHLDSRKVAEHQVRIARSGVG